MSVPCKIPTSFLTTYTFPLPRPPLDWWYSLANVFPLTIAASPPSLEIVFFRFLWSYFSMSFESSFDNLRFGTSARSSSSSSSSFLLRRDPFRPQCPPWRGGCSSRRCRRLSTSRDPHGSRLLRKIWVAVRGAPLGTKRVFNSKKFFGQKCLNWCMNYVWTIAYTHIWVLFTLRPTQKSRFYSLKKLN